MSSPGHHRPQPAIVFASFLLLLLAGIAWSAGSILHSSVAVLAAARVTAPSTPESRIAVGYGKLPISFEVNQGQTDKSVQFLARGAGYTLFLRPGEAVLSLHPRLGDAGVPGSVAPQSLRGMRASSGQRTSMPPPLAVRLKLIGSNTAAKAVGVDPLPGKSNYFVGNDPAQWHTDVPTYEKVRYSDIYPGIDLIYYGNQEDRLEHDLVVAPGADPSAIRIEAQNANIAVRQQNGNLIFRTTAGDISLETPVAYQMIDGKRRTIPASYAVASNNQFRFEIGSYDRNAPLVIDPVLVYSAVFGGSSGSLAWAMAIDGSGNTYVTGYTWSNDFPVVNPLQASFTALNAGVFVSKINAAGTALLYSTFLGEDGGGLGITVDVAGRAYVVGNAGPGLPVKNAYQPTGNGSRLRPGGKYAGVLHLFWRGVWLRDRGCCRRFRKCIHNRGGQCIAYRRHICREIQ